MMDRMQYWDWDDTWQAFILLVLAVLAGLVIFAACQDHTVQRYYVDSPQDHPVSSCVYAEYNWWLDSSVFCSGDPAQVLEYAVHANQLLAFSRGRAVQHELQ